MKSVLLVGCGAEIGATLIGMNNPEIDGFHIDTVLTRVIDGDSYNPHLKPIDSLFARIVLAQPHLLDKVKVIYENDSLVAHGKEISVHWGDSETFDLSLMNKEFDVCILATSKKQIGNPDIINRFLEISNYVVGVSEAPGIPTLYANLKDAPKGILVNSPQPIGDHRVLAMGSCQSNGWHSTLRAVLELAKKHELTLEMKAMEIDIVHPDTPTGRLGTKSVEARSQDPRNNFRPSFSQIHMSMDLLFPESRNVNTVSLRTLIMPPGYQISRFFFRYTRPDDGRLTREDVLSSFEDTADKLPDTLRMAHVPLGSRGFEFSETSSIALSGERYLRFEDDAFSEGGLSPLSQLTVQSYVHNVRGYCRSVLNNVRYLIEDNNVEAIMPREMVKVAVPQVTNVASA
jgi:hypothetical protein